VTYPRVLAPLLVGVVVGSAIPVAFAAAPSSPTLSFATPSITWSQTGMNGSAPAQRRVTCKAPTACDDTTITIDGGGVPDAFAEVKITPSSGSQMTMVYFPPGCPVSETSGCLVGPTREARFSAPRTGSYVFRVSCTQCTNASYTATATMTHFVPQVGPAGDQGFAWQLQDLPSSTGCCVFPNTGEPGISLNGKGHGIVNTFGPTIWTTTDNGRSWSPPQVVDPVCDQVSGDADAVVAFDNTLYADNLCPPGNLSYTSRDGGKTWSGTQGTLPSAAGADADRPWFVADPKTPGVVYVAYHDFQQANMWVLKSFDYGETYSQQATVAITASNYVDTVAGNVDSRPVIDPIDPNVVSFIYASNFAQQSETASPSDKDLDLTQFYLAQSHDGGLTWTNTLLLDADQAFPYDGTHDNTVAHLLPSETIDTAGNIYLLFSMRLGPAKQTHMMFAALPRGSTKLNKPVQVDSGGLGSNVFGWIAAGDPGRVDMTWYGSIASDYTSAQATWSEVFAQTLNGLAAAPIFTQSRLSPGSMHNSDICVVATLCASAGGNRSLADFQGIAIDGCGYGQTVWTDDASGPALTIVGRQTGGAIVYDQNPCAAAAPSSGPLASRNERANPLTAPHPPGSAGTLLTILVTLLVLGALGRRARE
jgi:hypothetical protein